MSSLGKGRRETDGCFQVIQEDFAHKIIYKGFLAPLAKVVR